MTQIQNQLDRPIFSQLVRPDWLYSSENMYILLSAFVILPVTAD